ncbi:MAG: hypothetical protein ABJN26_00635 [Stappiaceae bacterium]
MKFILVWVFSPVIFALLLAVLPITRPVLSNEISLPAEYVLKYRDEKYSYLETHQYRVTLKPVDPNHSDDHLVEVTSKDGVFQATVPLGVQGDEVPTIVAVEDVTLCENETQLIADFRWSHTKDIVGYSYQRLILDRSSGALAADLDDVVSIQMGGLMPPHQLVHFYSIECSPSLSFSPRKFERHDGGGVSLSGPSEN